MRKLFLLLLLFPYFSFAQLKGNNWAIGDSILLKFTSNGINVGSSVIKASDISDRSDLEPMATISDDSGKLLFYTNGFTVWNKKNQLMKNGDSLQCDFSRTNGVLIVPYSGNDSLLRIIYLNS